MEWSALADYNQIILQGASLSTSATATFDSLSRRESTHYMSCMGTRRYTENKQQKVTRLLWS